jgi:hypothetical protein
MLSVAGLYTQRSQEDDKTEKGFQDSVPESKSSWLWARKS